MRYHRPLDEVTKCVFYVNVVRTAVIPKRSEKKKMKKKITLSKIGGGGGRGGGGKQDVLWEMCKNSPTRPPTLFLGLFLPLATF